MEFSRQEYWSGLPFPSPGDLPDSGSEPGSPALQADSLPSEPPGKPYKRQIISMCLAFHTIFGKCFYLSSRNIKENQNPRILKGILLITFISDALIHLELPAQSLKSLSGLLSINWHSKIYNFVFHWMLIYFPHYIIILKFAAQIFREQLCLKTSFKIK